MDESVLDELLNDVPVDGVAEAYDRRGLDRLSDDELVAAVAAVVAEPREGPADSFVLHAPLELAARSRLLAETPDEHRRIARLRLVSIAARYQTNEPAALATFDNGPGDRAGFDDGPGDRAGFDDGPGDRAGFDDGPRDGAGIEASAEDRLAATIDAVAAGDLAGAEAAVRALAAAPDLDPPTAVARLAAAVADRSAAAAHGPILFATLVEQPDRAANWLALARPLVRELARQPDWRLQWLGAAVSTHPESTDAGATVADPTDVAAGLGRVLADPPRLGVPGSSFIHPLLMQVDAPAVADTYLRPVVDPATPVTPATAATITRVAALAMVDDDPNHAPYGWTHCLTLPQAILTLAPVVEPFGVPALAIAATHVLAFRAAQASRAVDLADPRITPADPTTFADRRRALVVEAARRHDAHIAKYVLAVLTEAERDAAASELYLRAGEHLLAVWDDRGPDPDDILAPALV